MKIKTITKEWLESQNITIEGDKIYHISNRCGKQELIPSNKTSNQKLSKGKTYGHIGWYSSQDHKQYNFLAHRVIYAWYKGSSNSNMDIDHINGNSLDNRIENLQEISHKDNLNRRNGNGHNNSIYYGMGGLLNEDVDELKEESKKIQNIKKECIKTNKEVRKAIKSFKELLRMNTIEYKKSIVGLTYNDDEYLEKRTKYLRERKMITKHIGRLQDGIHKNVSYYTRLERDFRKMCKSIREED